MKSLLSCSGNFYEPTILAIDGAAPASNSAFQTEFFGPVVCLTPFNSEEEGSSLILE
jgi:acyl-CoA reductase-like NAD-dependent aldehyde dehydrogenase